MRENERFKKGLFGGIKGRLETPLNDDNEEHDDEDVDDVGLVERGLMLFVDKRRL